MQTLCCSSSSFVNNPDELLLSRRGEEVAGGVWEEVGKACSIRWLHVCSSFIAQQGEVCVCVSRIGTEKRERNKKSELEIRQTRPKHGKRFEKCVCVDVVFDSPAGKISKMKGNRATAVYIDLFQSTLFKWCQRCACPRPDGRRRESILL